MREARSHVAFVLPSTERKSDSTSQPGHRPAIDRFAHDAALGPWAVRRSGNQASDFIN